jgi:hypothetical protein
VHAYGDSKLEVENITGESQCLDGVLNSYRDRCLDIVRSLDSFCIYHILREKNRGANTLAQCASGYEVTTGMFIVKEKPTSYNYESVDGEFCLGSGEAGNGPASHDPKHGASTAEMPQDMHAGTRPTLPVAKSSQASKGESNGKENSADGGSVKGRTMIDTLPAPQG